MGFNYDTWGGSWGTSWGGSWGRSTPPPVQPSVPGEVGGGAFFDVDPRIREAYQERERQRLQALLDRKREDERELRRLVEVAVRGEPEIAEAPTPTAVVALATEAKDSGIRASLADIRRILAEIARVDVELQRRAAAQEEEDMAVVLLLS